MQFAARNFALKNPDILQYHGLFVFFVLITHDAAGIGRGNLQQFLFDVGDQFAARNLGQSDLDRFFVFHFVIFALGRDAPAAKPVDLDDGD